MIELAKKAAQLIASMQNSDRKEEYLRAIKGLGSLVMQNGLIGALLITMKKGPEQIVEHLDQLIELRTGVKDYSKKVKEGNIEMQNYLYVQTASLEAIKWLKRYAEIILGGDSSET